MNRAERRRNQKKQDKKEQIYYISQQKLDEIRKKERENAVNEAITLLFSLPIRVLKDQYNWGNNKRLPEFAEHLCDAYQDFADSGRDLEAEVDFVYQMTGIKFERDSEL